MSKPLCIVGPQPMPRHGVSAVNEAVAELAKSGGLAVEVLNTAPASLDKSLGVRLARAGAIWAAWRQLGRSTPTVLYASVSGGWGMLWELGLNWRARRLGAAIILHHHSFRYLDADFLLASWLFRVAGPQALHVVLGGSMEQALRHRYPAVQRTLVVSNAAFMSEPSTASIGGDRTCRIIGHLSNLSTAKGVWDVVALAETAQREYLNLQFRLAGPFESDRTQDEFIERAKGLRNLTWEGPLYGPAKDRFFAEIDCFVFPTRYRNEAEPLVIHEALAQGCPVIAYDRGCIGNMVDATTGRLVARESDFTAVALDQIRAWQQDAISYEAARMEARRKFAALRQTSLVACKELLAEMGAIEEAGAPQV